MGAELIFPLIYPNILKGGVLLALLPGPFLSCLACQFSAQEKPTRASRAETAPGPSLGSGPKEALGRSLSREKRMKRTK